MNGGGLRALLEQSLYSVHEASYGSRLGENTDVFDWPAKFKDNMQDILARLKVKNAAAVQR